MPYAADSGERIDDVCGLVKVLPWWGVMPDSRSEEVWGEDDPVEDDRVDEEDWDDWDEWEEWEEEFDEDEEREPRPADDDW